MKIHGGGNRRLAIDILSHTACDALREGKIDVLVTAPINKASIQEKISGFVGHTEFLQGNFEGELEQDFYGNKLLSFKKVSRKPILPTEEEIKRNNRARSAKLRVAEKL